ncbi:hypothetical protein I7I53_01867 [Histoplasma capsulatum var. duboisii H88]|uniref:Uncharacterized protein n=1 Tax=Ajellomyces capsulatus (strain H88) TaxID=544711 RepID=A0A8A1LLK8_AJEC8|nr:hypothetical protein I7I53_01867 [Histoplasma capsulatum var. duboisii H88]
MACCKPSFSLPSLPRLRRTERTEHAFGARFFFLATVAAAANTNIEQLIDARTEWCCPTGRRFVSFLFFFLLCNHQLFQGPNLRSSTIPLLA